VTDYKREVDQLIHLRHPNILSFYGTMTEGGSLAIVTELMEGNTYDMYIFIHIYIYIHTSLSKFACVRIRM